MNKTNSTAKTIVVFFTEDKRGYEEFDCQKEAEKYGAYLSSLEIVKAVFFCEYEYEMTELMFVMKGEEESFFLLMVEPRDELTILMDDNFFRKGETKFGLTEKELCFNFFEDMTEKQNKTVTIAGQLECYSDETMKHIFKKFMEMGHTPKYESSINFRTNSTHEEVSFRVPREDLGKVFDLANIFKNGLSNEDHTVCLTKISF